MKAVVLRMYDYFDSLEQRVGGLGELSRPLEALGEQTSNTVVCWKECLPLCHNDVGYSERSIRRLWSEHTVSGMDFSSPAKHYKSSRRQIKLLL